MVLVDQVLPNQGLDDAPTAADPHRLSLLPAQPPDEGAGVLRREGDARRGGEGAVGDHKGVQPLIDPPVRGELGGHLVVGVPAHDHRVDPLEQTGVGLHPLLRLPVAAQPVHAALCIGDIPVQAHGNV